MLPPNSSDAKSDDAHQRHVHQQRPTSTTSSPAPVSTSGELAPLSMSSTLMRFRAAPHRTAPHRTVAWGNRTCYLTGCLINIHDWSVDELPCSDAIIHLIDLKVEVVGSVSLSVAGSLWTPRRAAPRHAAPPAAASQTRVVILFVIQFIH